MDSHMTKVSGGLNEERFEWRNSMHMLHRLDGPAMEYTNGDKLWLINGKLSNLNGPAVETFDDIEWWLDGQYYHSPGAMPFALFVAWLKWKANNG